MTEHAFVVTGTSPDRTALIDVLHAHLDESFIEEHDLTVPVMTLIATGYNGTLDELAPCPFCDGTTLSVVEAEENIYTVTASGAIEYVERGDIGESILNVYCAECHEYLLKAPAHHVLNHA